MNVKARHTQNNFYTHGAVRLCNDCFILLLLLLLFFPAAVVAVGVVGAATAASVAVLLQPLTA